MQNAKRAALEFCLQWQSSFGRHYDRRYIEKIDFWRDLLPGSLQKHLSGLSPGEKYLETFSPGVLVPGYSDKNIIEFPKGLFAGSNGKTIAAVPGRFYPKRCAWRALKSFPDDPAPFRLIETSDKTLTADTNHPLAKYHLGIEGTMIEHLKAVVQRGGSANDLSLLLTSDGPGMQLPWGQFYENIYRDYPFRRSNEVDDREFYQSPRLVHHLDSTARSHVRRIYARLLSPGMRVLDLMSSWESHIPEKLKTCEVAGIGLNKEELESNEQLTNHTVRDLNKKPHLPYSDRYFDAAVCTVSIEYLIRPREVIAEVARVIRPGGLFVIIVSDRWFPGKQILQWTDLHPFERQGFILNYLLQEKGFDELQTESLRGYPRPAEDKYSNEVSLSDSLFIITGRTSR